MHKLNHLFVSETGTNHMFQLATFSNKLDSTLKVTKVFCQWILGDTLETSQTVIFLYCECSLCYPFEAQTQRFWVARSFPPVQNSVDKSEMKIGLVLWFTKIVGATESNVKKNFSCTKVELCWNKAVLLVANSNVTWNTQSEYFISTKHRYSNFFMTLGPGNRRMYWTLELVHRQWRLKFFLLDARKSFPSKNERVLGSGWAQLVEWSLPKPEVRGLNPVIGEILFMYSLSTVLKRQK